MILAFTLFGKPQNDTLVSKEELFIMFCVFQYRPVVGASFMIARLLSIAQAPHGPICVGGLVTMIAKALFSREPLSCLTPAGNYTPLDLTLCFNVGMIRCLEPNQFQLLIHHEPVYHFTLPDIARSSVHDRKNWIYDLEGIAENDMEEEESDPLTPPHYYDPLVGLGEFDPEMAETDPVTPPLLDRHPA